MSQTVRRFVSNTALFEEFHGKKVNLYPHIQGVDTTTPSGKAMFQMMGVFAQFERSLIQGRVKFGLERTKAQGKRLGRPPVPPLFRGRKSSVNGIRDCPTAR